MFLGQARRITRNFLRNRYGFNFKEARLNQYQEQFAYGHREVLLDYSNQPRNIVFKAILAHGKILPHSLDPIIPAFDILDGKEISQLLWRDDALEDAKLAGVTSAFAIGAPFLYVLSNLGQTISQTRSNIVDLSNYLCLSPKMKINDIANSKKVTYFPLHSWEGDVNQHSISSKFLLKELDPKRVRVCLGFLDYCDPAVRKVYEQFGWETVCAGVRDSMIIGSPAGGRERFLYSLAEIISDADFVIANEFTTALFYAAALGKKIAIIESPELQSLSFSTWNDNGSFNSLIGGPKKLYPWLIDGDCNADQISRDIHTALGVHSFKEPSFFQTQVDKIEFNAQRNIW